MWNKFMYLIHYSLKKKFKSKSFIITNIVLVVLLIGILNIDSLIRFFGGDFENEDIIYIVNDTSYEIEEGFKQNFYNMTQLYGDRYENPIETLNLSYEEAKEKVADNSNILLHIEEDEKNYIKVAVISSESIDAMFYQNLLQALTNVKQQIALKESSIDLEELNEIYSPLSVERVLLDENGGESEDMDTIMGTLLPILILPFFMLILFLIQLIGGEINEEKQTRSMEIIISNVTPKAHFFSKIISANIFILVQSFLLFLYGGLGLLIRKLLTSGESLGIVDRVGTITTAVKESGILNQLSSAIPIAIVLVLLSFLAYSLIAGILASMTVNIEDYQQIQTPIIFICLGGYYLSMMAGMFEGSMLIRVLSYVPLISCMLAPTLFALGQITIIDVLISVALLILLIYFLIRYGMKVYKAGILNYSTDKMWKRVLKALRE